MPADPDALKLAVGDRSDLAVARSQILRFAAARGLDPRRAAELALAASELASNMLKYAGGGELLVLAEPDALLVEASDRGPGPPSEAELFADGVSRGAARQPDQSITTGLGTGGGAVRRLCDRVEILARPGGGTIIRCRKHTTTPHAGTSTR